MEDIKFSIIKLSNLKDWYILKNNETGVICIEGDLETLTCLLTDMGLEYTLESKISKVKKNKKRNIKGS